MYVHAAPDEPNFTELAPVNSQGTYGRVHRQGHGRVNHQDGRRPQAPHAARLEFSDDDERESVRHDPRSADQEQSILSSDMWTASRRIRLLAARPAHDKAEPAPPSW